MDKLVTIVVPKNTDATQYVKMVREWCAANNITAAFMMVKTEYNINYSETSDYRVKHTWKIGKDYAALFLLKWAS